MSEKEGKKKRKTRVVRSPGERIADLKAKLAEEEAKASLVSLKTAVKDGRVEEEKVKEYSKLLRHMKVLEKAPGVFDAWKMKAEAQAAAGLRDTVIEKMKGLLAAGSDEGESDEDDEDEDEDEDDEDDEDEDDEDDEDED